jgi:hypothetical protein
VEQQAREEREANDASSKRVSTSALDDRAHATMLQRMMTRARGAFSTSSSTSQRAPPARRN